MAGEINEKTGQITALKASLSSMIEVTKNMSQEINDQKEEICKKCKDLENKTGEIAALKVTLASMTEVTKNMSGEINEKKE